MNADKGQASAAPDPLTPWDCDLRGLGYMPLHIQHLLGSMFNLTATDAEFRAGFNLFCSAWGQRPAGSLPNDERALSVLAGVGPDIARWMAVRPMAMRNWVLCSDGRWYHPFLCEQALVAQKARVGARARKAKWMAKQAGEPKGDAKGTGAGMSQERAGNGSGTAEAKRSEATGSQSPTEIGVPLLRNGSPARDATSGQDVPPPRQPADRQAQQNSRLSSGDVRKRPGVARGRDDEPRVWMNDDEALSAMGEQLGLGSLSQWVAAGGDRTDFQREAISHWTAQRQPTQSAGRSAARRGAH